jgi:hypothetical protein
MGVKALRRVGFFADYVKAKSSSVRATRQRGASLRVFRAANCRARLAWRYASERQRTFRMLTRPQVQRPGSGILAHFAGYTRIQWLRTRAFTRVSLKSRTSEFDACTGMWQSMQLGAV